jgi:hypothetical protein
MICMCQRAWGIVVMATSAMLMTSAASADSIVVESDLPSFGMVGMAPATQFVRLSVSNMRVVGLGFLAPPGTRLVAACTVTLSFKDDQGRTLKRADSHLTPGQSMSLDLVASDLPPLSAGRVEVLPAVQRAGGCILTPSVEVITTNTSETDAYMLRKSANGNGFLPVYGLVGMALRSQFIRLNVSNQAIPGAPRFGDCNVVLTFSDARDGTLKQSGQIALALGTSTLLDLTTADLSTPSTDLPRVEVLPSLANSGTCALNSSVEVISTATGQTSAYAEDAVLSTNR